MLKSTPRLDLQAKPLERFPIGIPTEETFQGLSLTPLSISFKKFIEIILSALGLAELQKKSSYIYSTSERSYYLADNKIIRPLRGRENVFARTFYNSTTSMRSELFQCIFWFEYAVFFRSFTPFYAKELNGVL